MSDDRLDLVALDIDGALAEAHDGLTRAGFIVAAGAAVAGFAALRADDAHAAGIPASDQEILNYALVLEYLQAAFYTEAERAKALKGRAAEAAKVVGAVERAHVKAFRDLLGKQAVGEPHFDFQGVTEKNGSFLKTAVAFEDLAVAAYKGQARRIRSRAVLTSALGIHTVEARHAAWMRYLNGNTPAAAAFDRPLQPQGDQQDRRVDALHQAAAAQHRQTQTRLHGVRRAAMIALGLVVGSAGGAAVVAAGSPDDDEPATRRSSLATPARAALAIPTPRDLADAPGLTRWAHVRRGVAARVRPGRSRRVVARVRRLTPEGTVTALPVTGRRTGRDGRLWMRVALPVLPNGTSGWVPRRALGAYELSHHRLVVDLGRKRLTLLDRGHVVMRAPVGVGQSRWPTPRGRFLVRNRLERYASPEYGPVAFGTSARSATLTDWPAGGFVGIHGTDRPDLIPGAVSHGCVRLRNPEMLRLARLMPVGTPVIIR